MKKTVLLILAAVLILGSCDLNGSTSKTASIASVDLFGADGYLRVWNSPAKLNAVDGAEIKEVVWTDELGSKVSVPVTESKLLGKDHMALRYTYGEETKTEIANISTGDLVEIPNPADWSEIKYRNDSMYYVSGGSVLKVDPVGGSPETLSGSDVVPSGFLVMGKTDVPYVMTGSFKKSYPGGVARELGGPAVERLYSGLSAAESGGVVSHSLIYDDVADTYYMLNWSSNLYWEQVLNTDGSVQEGTASALSHTFAGGARRVGFGTPTGDNSVFTDGYDVAMVSVSGGSVTVDSAYTETTFGQHAADAKYVDGLFYYKSNTFNSMVFQIRESDLVSSDRVLVEVGIYDLEDWDIVAGQLFWIDNTGSWVMDLGTGVIEAYQASAVEAVRE